MKTRTAAAPAAERVVIAGHAALLRHQAGRNLTDADSAALMRDAGLSRAALSGVIRACDSAISKCADAKFAMDCDADAAHVAAAVTAAQAQLDKATVLYDAYADGTIYGGGDA